MPQAEPESVRVVGTRVNQGGHVADDVGDQVPRARADAEACCASLRREYGVFGLEEYLETKAIIGFG